MQNKTAPTQVSQTAPKTFFGFALADGMFAGAQTIVRREVTAGQVRELVSAGVESCLNPSHVATIGAMRSRYGLDVAIPVAPPRVVLRPGDSVIVMGVRGLPRLTDRHEYTEEEVAQATFAFAKYTVCAVKCPSCGTLSPAPPLPPKGWYECSNEACCLDLGQDQVVSGA